MADSNRATVPPSRPRTTRVTRVVLAIAIAAGAFGAYAAFTAGAWTGAGASSPLARGEGPAPREGRASPPAAPNADGTPERLRVRVLASFPHDPESYTQGLLWDGDALVESAGGYGDSLVRRWRPGDARPIAEERLSDRIFAEGIAAVGETLVQLTWREGIAFYRDRVTLRQKARRSYEGEGWGLCYDGRRLIMSDGTHLLTERDPESFLELRRVAVTVRTKEGGNTPVEELNELECVEGSVYANIYETDQIARIDPSNGRVTGMIDASGLLTSDERAAAHVLNGIAYNARTETFYLTGKLWPRLFEVRFEPAAESPADSP